MYTLLAWNAPNSPLIVVFRSVSRDAVFAKVRELRDGPHAWPNLEIIAPNGEPIDC